MRKIILLLLCITVGALGASCGEAPANAETDEPMVTGVAIALTAPGWTGAEYRLTKGTFIIDGTAYYGDPVHMEVSIPSDQTEPVLEVPVEAGEYNVKLTDWTLAVSFEGRPFTEVEASLMEDTLWAYVSEYQATSLTFPFILGQTELELGISVEENGHLPPGYVPEGYDGVLLQIQDGRYYIILADGWGVCCFQTVEEVEQYYPNYRLYPRQTDAF